MPPLTQAEFYATIWRVSELGTTRKPGRVLRARMTYPQAEQHARDLRASGVECVVSRVDETQREKR
jgi:hydroxypyruvate isomerase